MKLSEAMREKMLLSFELFHQRQKKAWQICREPLNIS